jgi:sialate O-acetylesterase
MKLLTNCLLSRHGYLSLAMKGGEISRSLLLCAFLIPSLVFSASYAAVHHCPVDADLWVMGGQSNMSGCGRFDETIRTDSNILMFNMDNTWQVAQDPLHRIYDSNHPAIRNYFFNVHKGNEASFLENRAKLKENPQNAFILGVGMGMSFAEHLRKYTDRPIGLIPCAYGGTLMKDWDPAIKTDVNNSLYNYMLERIQMAGGNIKGILWSQGEGDACYDDKALTYEKAMLNFIDTLRQDVNKPDLPFLMVQTGRFSTAGSSQPGPAWEKVRDAQRRIAEQRKNVYVIGAIDLPLDDPIHISCEGHRRLGRRLAEIALTNVYRKTGHSNAIDIESVEYADPNKVIAPPCFPKPIQFRIQFSGVSGRLTAAGRPTGFQLRNEATAKNVPMFYRTDFDPQDPAAVILWVGLSAAPPPEPGLKLIYGGGMDPYVNIVDETDMPLPAFGPIDMPLKPGVIKITSSASN